MNFTTDIQLAPYGNTAWNYTSIPPLPIPSWRSQTKLYNKHNNEPSRGEEDWKQRRME